MYLSNTSVLRGDSLSLSGITFTPTGNTVHLDAYVIPNISAAQSGTIRFTIPSDVPFGEHEIWITNSSGESNKKWIVVTEKNVVAPAVTSITPDKGPKGTSVTLTGTGFLNKGNTVRTSYGLITDLSSSDGVTIQLTVSPSIPTFKKSTVIPVWMWVVNSNGVSSPVEFQLSI